METALKVDNLPTIPSNDAYPRQTPPPLPSDTDAGGSSSWYRTIDVSKLLRWGGGALLTASAVSFMCQGFYSFAPMTRHWVFVTLCVVLGLLGMATGAVLKETKGARSFLGFAAASFPVLASQMGAMIYSLFGQAPAGMPQPLVFTSLTSTAVSMTTGLTLGIVVPISYLGFKVLARSQAACLTGLYTLANLGILIPMRQETWIGWVFTGVAAMLYIADSHLLGRDFRLANFEGRMARVILALPLVVIFGRSLFYPVGHQFIALTVALAGLYFSFHWGRVLNAGPLKTVMQVFGNVSLILGWLVFIVPLIETGTYSVGWSLYAVLLPLAGMIGLHTLVGDGVAASRYRNTAAATAMLAVVGAHLMDGALGLSASGLLVGFMLLVMAVLTGEKAAFWAGCVAVVVCLLNLAFEAFAVHANYAWVILAVVGIVILFSASLVEKSKARWQHKMRVLWHRMG